MKTEITDVSETRKHLSFEVPPETSSTPKSSAWPRATRDRRKCPGFRPGKVPASVVRQRYKDQILLRRGARPDSHASSATRCGSAGFSRSRRRTSRTSCIEEGQPLTFVADFETLPPIDPGEYTGLSLRKPPAVLDVGAVDHALEHLQQRHARWQPVEDRPADKGDTLLLDLTRTRRTSVIEIPGERRPARGGADDKPETLQNVSIELGAPANPPGFDEHLIGTSAGDTREFTVTYPADYAIAGAGGRDRRLRRHGQGHSPQGAAAARRRVREGSQRGRNARGAADAHSRGPAEAAPSRKPSTRCGTTCCGSSPSALKAAPDVLVDRESRPPARGVRATADGSGRRSDEGERRLAGLPRAAA